jgi:hypothetical protein
MDSGVEGQPSAPPSYLYMKLIVTLGGSSKFNPIIRLSGGSGRVYSFGWNDEFKAHVWSRGFVASADAADIDDIFATKDPFYRPSVKIIKEDEVPAVEEQASEAEVQPVQRTKKTGRRTAVKA